MTGKRDSDRAGTWLALLCLGGVLALALGLRLYRLDGQSLWYDEGNSVALAQRDVATIIASAAADIHPPLYYLALSAWVRVAGVGDAGVRLLSVLLGALTVLIVYALGRRMAGRAAGLLAAAAAAVSPFLVYYAQETRMYMLATLLATLSAYLFLRLVEHDAGGAGRRALWPAYVLATAGALYSHYFAATAILAQGLVVLWQLVRAVGIQRGMGDAARRLWPAIAGFMAVAALYVPWLPVMVRQFGNWPAISEFYTLPELIARLFPIFSLGFSIEPAAVRGALLVFAAVVVIGAWPQGRRGGESTQQNGTAQLLIVLWLLAPVLAMFALSLRRPLYNPKFLLVAAPAFSLLLGNGLRRLAQTSTWRYGGLLVAAAAALVIAVFSGRSLQAYYTDARYARDDYRGALATITAGERDGDAILLNAPGQIDIIGHYYHGQTPIYQLPRQRPLLEQETLDELAQIAAGHRRIWVVYYGDEQADPRRVIASWLEAHTYKASDRWFGNVRLVLYVLPPAQTGAMQPLNVQAGPSIKLTGYRLETDRTVAGDIVPLTLYWQATGAVAQRYTVFAHVINAHDVLWGQRDSEPGGGLRPTDTWQPGETIQDNYGLPILAGTPPGEYQIEIGLYDASTGQRLPLTGAGGEALGDRVLLGSLVVARPATPPAAAALGMQHPLAASIGPIKLLGYSLARLGQEPAAADFAGSDVLHLTLFWQAPPQPPADLTIVVQVRDAAGNVVRQRASKPADGDYPTNGWSTGEIVRDQHRLALDGLAAGAYRLAVETQEASGRRAGQAALGELRVR